ncbi:MAG: metal ABC transporter substrate-binding protein [Drouetiella hepatica Uher 2000/2452]|uniref:Metal ABC transporter substrate-binding protein n=1 Tax=Drouetiella hepatica Uher 2000/2452 TaxID=904376 RepID=A0A951Q900_9CYAN|nr:metal ABC transporter substrate-binding protein [Drouetiella hepatica Uher 2000/2452]
MRHKPPFNKHFRVVNLYPIGLVGLLVGVWISGCTPTTPTQPREESRTTTTTPARNDKKVILTTFTVLADMVRNVAGDKAIVESITKPGAEIHGYQVTPSDLERGQKADLILENGLNLERWADRFHNSLPKVPRITLSDGLQTVNIAEDAYQGKPNPHAWMSPKNALIYVENIRKALGNLDPANAITYDANAKTYSEQIRAIDEKLKQAIATIPADKRYIVSCEGAFSYIARDYGLKEVYLWAVNAEQQSTPKQLEKVINTVKANQIPAVFCESTVSNETQLQVAKETGANFAGVFYVDSLSSADGPASTYLRLLEYNVNTLIKGLQEK